jgi:hypothetical protein
MNVGLGCAFVIIALAFGDQASQVLGVLPAWVLAAFLAYAGIRHALLVADQRGVDLCIAIAAGAIGAWRGNLAITVAIGVVYGGVRAGVARRLTPLPASVG